MAVQIQVQVLSLISAGVTSSVAVRYKKSISIIETVISIDYRYISTSWHLILAIVPVVYGVGDN